MTTKRLPLKSLVYASMFGALTAVGAYISIPLYPVPVTLQTVFTVLAGLLLGGPVAALSQVVYVLLGVVGLPVFSGGKAGLGVLLGPTGGYLVGFVVGAYVIGKLAQARRDGGVLWLLLCVIAGEIVIYGVGVLQLSQVTHMAIAKALAVGMLPFLPGDAIKVAASVSIAARLKKQHRIMGRLGTT